MSEALIVVDVQNDFCKGGSLEVNGAAEIIPLINSLTNRFKANNQLIVFSRDWHPVNHVSFKQRGGPWPPHCVQNTWGSQFHSELSVPENAVVVSKGTNPEQDAYSAFQGTELRAVLESRNIRKIYVVGLTAEYCVKNTVLDAVRAGMDTHVLRDATRGVGAKPGDIESAFSEMLRGGAVVEMWRESKW